jgi:LytS/YehU family sensor histidine kinase
MSTDASPRHILRHFLIVLCINTLIAACLAVSDAGKTFISQFIYAQSIGIVSWALIDFGRFAIKRDPDSGWPKGWRAIALPAFGVTVGNLVGSVIGDLLTGLDRMSVLHHHSTREMLGHLLYFGTIGGVVAYFFWATGRAKHYAEVIATTRREAAETQLMLLQSQLEPHMLFNTLANLRALISADPNRAQEMLDHLIAFLRSTLSASRTVQHPLSTEFERTADYLALMKIRMGDRLATELNLPGDLAGTMVPTLLLQPLVENAIKHGLEPHIAGGRISVHARRDGQHLVIDVRDTGVGLDATSSAQGTQFGLEQVRKRLSTRHGAQASLTLAAAADSGGGTLASVRLPLETAR